MDVVTNVIFVEGAATVKEEFMCSLCSKTYLELTEVYGAERYKRVAFVFTVVLAIQINIRIMKKLITFK